ncbi:rubredoxin [Streptomyces subrutilus]|uniref:Rubredoxin n=1 Tax=Streptomyces subrutilus TaxID=36818 RepID=A0A5P2UE09_9ACTN|nr:rubredoxin [Streptomyces subrutilus]
MDRHVVGTCGQVFGDPVGDPFGCAPGEDLVDETVASRC